MKIESFSAEALPNALAARVADDLRRAIERRGRATIAVPGGSTPEEFLTALGKQDLDWSRVCVTLTDERAVPADDRRSNRGMVERTLLQGAARVATFVALHDPETKTEQIAADLSDRVIPLDVCVLGMGEDMHTASLFPGMPGLAELLDPACEQVVADVRPADAPEARITLTGSALASAANTYVLIRGPKKKAALDRALATAEVTEAPVHAIIRASQSVSVFYAE